MMKRRTLNQEGYKQEACAWEAQTEKAAVGPKMPTVASRVLETMF